MKYRILWRLLLYLCCNYMAVDAQNVRSAYFMDVPERLNMNPGLLPSHSFFKFPGLGISGEYTSNALSLQDLMDVTDDEKTIKNKQGFLDRLENFNRAQANVEVDVISFGVYSGKHFISGHIGVRVKGYGSLPKGIFEFANALNDVESLGDYDIPEANLSFQGYGEIGLGYGIEVAHRFMIGARVNFLMPITQSRLTMKSLKVVRAGEYARIIPDAQMSISPDISGEDSEDDYPMKNGNYNEGNDLYNELCFSDMEPAFGLSGFGFGIDFGLSFKATDRLTVSAALVDFGFANWKNTTIGDAQQSEMFIYDLPASVIDEDILSFRNVGKESVRYGLNPQVNLGAEYAFLHNTLSAGILSSTRFYDSFITTELTLSGNYRPKSYVGLTLSYSMIQSNFQTIGFGLKLGPLFVGSDYLFFKSPLHSKNMSGYIGINIPLGKKHD